MIPLGQEYQELLEEELKNYEMCREKPKTAFFSSVTCMLMDASPLPSSYWVRNLVSPVRFSSAVSNLIVDKGIGIFLEIGSHSALAGPLRQICAANNHPYNHIPAMVRGQNCVINFLSAVGRLYQEGVEIDFSALFPNGKALSGLPLYPWDHSTSYWNESRVSKAWRTRKYPHHCLLGSRLLEAADIEPQWRNVLHIEDEPWLADHKIHDDIVFPFTGYVTLAGEAIRQITHSSPGTGYRLRHVVAHTALLLSYSQPTELITSLRRCKLTNSDDNDWFDFSVISCTGSTWVKHCDGRVALLKTLRSSSWLPKTLPRSVDCFRFYDEMRKTGFVYGAEFQGLSNVSSSTTKELATSDISNRNEQSRHLFTLHPATIDACLQLLIVAMAKGLTRNLIELSVPTVIEELEISAGSDIMHSRAWNRFGNKELTCVECVADGKMVLHASGIQFRALEDHAVSEKKDVYGAARLKWAPDFDFVDLSTLFSPPVSDRIEAKLQEELVLLFILETAERITSLAPCQPHFTKFRDWLNNEIEVAKSGNYELVEESGRYVKLTSEKRLVMIDERVTALMQMGRQAVTTGLKRIFDNAEKLFTGAADTLEVLLKENALAKIYDVISFDFAPFIRSLAHTRPNLRILEVGAGTGGTTETILRSLMNSGGVPAYANYTFTDVSAGFFPTAKERFAYASNLDFKVFDITKEPLEQGFKESSYDLILAANVIHATPFLRQTLSNLQPLLRSDGMLVMTEICSTSRASSYIFGNFSGWWLGEADGREHRPYVSVSRWDEDLKASGFTGVDTTVYDDEEPYRQCAVIVCRKVNNLKATNKSRITILSEDSEVGVAHSLVELYRARDWEVTICRLEDDLPQDQDIISCLDLETKFFENITEQSFTSFQVLIRSIGANKLLWLSNPSQMKCYNPHSAQTLGVTRTLRSELAYQFYTLEIDSNELQFGSLVDKVFNKIRVQEDRDNVDSDKEFIVDSGVICIGRYHPFSLMEEVRIKSNEGHERATKTLEIGKPGMLESLAWKIKPILVAIPKTHVEVEVRTVGINFRDVSIVTGLMSTGSSSSYNTLGMEIAGTVQRIGDEVTGLEIGDRVMAFTINGGFSTNVILAEHHIIKIPDDMSYKEAATIQATFGTVVYALLDTGRLGKERRSVLIHSACGGVGLAAIQVCQMMGAEIFVTVGNEQKRQYLVNNYGISKDRIFSSRDSSFYEGVMRETAGVGVDLVLNSLSGELLHESWRCVARNGALLELGKRDLVGSGKLDMSHFLDNRSYCGVDMLYLVAERPWIVRE
jgi:NADPH:quinone reductase-like Zn-dependent oxidoreductase/SAM-dependent methyltransferase